MPSNPAAWLYKKGNGSVIATASSGSTYAMNSFVYGDGNELVHGKLIDFTESDGTVTYTGSTPRIFKVTTTFTFESSGSTIRYQFEIRVNGSVSSTSPSYRIEGVVNNSGRITTTLTAVVTMYNGHSVELYGGTSDASSINMDEISFLVEPLPFISFF